MPKIIGQSDQTFTVLQDNGSVTSIARDAISPELVSEISGFGSAIENEAPIIPEAQPVQEQVVNEPVLEEAPIEQAPPSRLDRALGAETRIADIQAKTAQETLQNLRANDAATRAFDLEQREREAERSKQFDEFALKAEKASEEFAKAEIKDPYASKSTGNKILAAISLGLGAFGAALTGGENTAMKIINSAIDRDIEIQKADINKKGDAVQNSRNLLADLTKKFGDERVAEAMTRRLLLESALRQNNITAAKFQGPLIQANSQKNKTMLEQAIQEQDLKISQLGTNVLDKQLDIAKKQKELSDVPELDKDLRDRIVPGVGVAISSQGLKEVKESFADTDASIKLIDRIIDEGSKFGSSIDPKTSGRINTLLTQLIGKLRIPFTGPGILTEPEKKDIRNAIGDPSKILSIKSLELGKLSLVKDTLRDALDSKKKAFGIEAFPENDRRFDRFRSIIDEESLQRKESEIQNLGGLSEANIEWAKQNTDNPDPSKAAKAQTILDKVRIKNNPAPVRANR